MLMRSALTREAFRMMNKTSRVVILAVFPSACSIIITASANFSHASTWRVINGSDLHLRTT